jgi:hypothetical protein
VQISPCVGEFLVDRTPGSWDGVYPRHRGRMTGNSIPFLWTA